MTLPADTIAALEERLLDPAAVPRSMPPSCYVDPAMRAAEVERAFLNGWVCVGRADEIPRARATTTRWSSWTSPWSSSGRPMEASRCCRTCVGTGAA